ncbi:16S rRNA (guanine(527)-N(7))-methyltransferase RsmG [Marivita sp. S0852]|uniref:16S rRNA (guanine(527)-N(7))-methyltransferase RsmG n=1 Tax=Marivita sp. S0852 TaxID=3373893 RepID=UPI003981B154
MNVSRETQERLDIHLKLLKKWSPKINLVSAASLSDAAKRHFEDSVQIAELNRKKALHWADLGSGGGFPGAAIAILKYETCPETKVTLVESDQRKAAFLKTVSREVGVPFTVLAQRIEDIPPLNADILSARALAPLSDLLSYAELHLKSEGLAIFPKGITWKEEVAEAEKKWRFSLQSHKSTTNPDAAILEIGDLSRA